MRFSIRWRLVLSYMLLTALAVGGVGALALALIQTNIAQRETDLLRVNASAVARQAAPMLTQGADRYALQQLADTAAFLGNAQVRILDHDGSLIVDSGPNRSADRMMWIAPQPSTQRAPSLTQQRGPVFVVGLQSHDGNPINLDDVDFSNAPWLRSVVGDARVVMIERVAGAYGSRFRFAEISATAFSPAPQNLVPPEASTSTYTSLAASPPDSAARVSVPIPTDAAGTPALGFVEMNGMTSTSAETLADAERALLLAGIGAAALALLVGLMVSRGLTAPVLALETATGKMALGNLSARAPKPRKFLRDETDQLADQFNSMAEKLERSFNALAQERDALRRFVADASHELRTPITSLKVANDLLLTDIGNDPVTREEFLRQNDAQLKRLEWITSNLLDLSRLDAGIASLNIAEHDASDIAVAAARPYARVADQKGIALVMQPQVPAPPIVLRCDRARLEIALSNLIDNALKFTPSGGQVAVSVERDDGHVRFAVRDTGIGVPVSDQLHIFERFYRGQNQDAGINGSGLGLAIVKSIAQAQGGTVAVTSVVGQGSTFTIALPLAAAPAR